MGAVFGGHPLYLAMLSWYRDLAGIMTLHLSGGVGRDYQLHTEEYGNRTHLEQRLKLDMLYCQVYRFLYRSLLGRWLLGWKWYWTWK
jgi:hypothetical protein